MKTLKNKYLLALASMALFSVVVSGCKDDVLGATGELPDDTETVDNETFYMALRIYNASSIDASLNSRANDPTYDSDGNDTQGDKSFNIGLASENAICNNYTSKEDCPNFLLVFGESGGTLADKLEYMFPLFDWDYENNGSATSSDGDGTSSSDYKAYYNFYTSAKRYELPTSFENRKVLAVLNASNALRAKLKSATTTNATYQDVLNFTVEQQAGEGASDYLYYKTTDPTTKKSVTYLTMSSSMVIPKVDMSGNNKAMTPNGTFGPSVIKRNYTWKATKKEAVKEPVYSFFMERLQSKVTLTFSAKMTETGGHTTITKCYFSDDPDATPADGYTRVEHLIIPSTDLAKLDPEWQTIRYVSTYHNRQSSLHEEDFVKKADHWKINIAGWGINGLEKEEYVFKHLTPNTEYYTGWNLEAYSPYRNFWAEDRNYSSTWYPDQYRKAKKLTKGPNEEGETSKAIKFAQIVLNNDVTSWSEENATLNYLPYTNLNNRVPHLYAPENTFDKSVFPSDKLADGKIYGSRDFLRAGTHVIIAAQLLIHGLEPDGVCDNPRFRASGLVENTDGEMASSKYYMNNIFWSRDAYKEYVGEYLGYWMQQDEDTFGPNDGVFYVTDTEDYSNMTPADADYFFVEPLMIEGSDGMVHVIPDLSKKYSEEYLANLTDQQRDDLVVFYAYNPNSTEDYKYTPITLGTFEKLALSQPQYFAMHFNYGMMYYAIPLTHYIKNIDDPFDIYTGKYGAVRNHWYSINVDNIRGIGTPVDEPAQELIIPNNEHSYDALGLTLSILPWHVVSTEVDISDQLQQTPPDEIDIDLQIKADDWIYDPDEKEY